MGEDRGCWEICDSNRQKRREEGGEAGEEMPEKNEPAFVSVKPHPIFFLQSGAIGSAVIGQGPARAEVRKTGSPTEGGAADSTMLNRGDRGESCQILIAASDPLRATRSLPVTDSTRATHNLGPHSLDDLTTAESVVWVCCLSRLRSDLSLSLRPPMPRLNESMTSKAGLTST